MEPIKLKRSHPQTDRSFSLPASVYAIGIVLTLVVLGTYITSYGFPTGPALLGLALLLYVVGYVFCKILDVKPIQGGCQQNF